MARAIVGAWATYALARTPPSSLAAAPSSLWCSWPQRRLLLEKTSSSQRNSPSKKGAGQTTRRAKEEERSNASLFSITL